MERPTAAPAHFPYAHRTLAEVPDHPSSHNAVVWVSDLLDALRQYRLDGKSYIECAELLGVSIPVVARKCQQMRWNARPRHKMNPGHRGWL